MHIDELSKKVDSLEKAVTAEGQPWIPENHTIFLTHKQWYLMVHHRDFLSLPRGIQWDLNPDMVTAGRRGKWKYVNIMVVKELPEVTS